MILRNISGGVLQFGGFQPDQETEFIHEQHKITPMANNATVEIPDYLRTHPIIVDLLSSGNMEVVSFDPSGDSVVTTEEMGAFVDQTNDEFIFPAAGPLAGTADGTTPVEVEVQLVDANDVVNMFNNTLQVTVAVTGSAVIAETQPITMTAGKATVNITNAVAESVTVSLVDSETTGLTVTDTVGITYS